MSAKLIIVEGMDGTGKTTLAKHIAKTLGGVYWHASGHKSLHLSMHEYHKNILMNAQVNVDQGLRVVLDRSWPSEYAYGFTLRPEAALRSNVAKLRKICDDLVAQYVYCPGNMESFERHDLSHDALDHKYKFKQYEMIGKAYDEVMYPLIPVVYTIEEWGLRMDAFVETLV